MFRFGGGALQRGSTDTRWVHANLSRMSYILPVENWYL